METDKKDIDHDYYKLQPTKRKSTLTLFLSVIDGLYETRVMAVRILWNGKINKKLAFYEAELDYREEHIYVKKDGVWVPVQKMLRRADSVWSENDDYAELNNRNIINQNIAEWTKV